jgi:type IV pilus assembly protein PilB
MPIGDELKQLVIDNAPQDAIRNAAIDAGMRTLADEALRLVAQGETTIGEVLRTVYVH